MGQILDGKKISAEVLSEVNSRAAKLKEKGVQAGLATVLVGEDPASHVYVGQKIKKCEANGLASIHCPLPANASQQQVYDTVQKLNEDPNVHGMIVQLPLPKGIDPEPIINSIRPDKDADGLHPYNQGLIGRLKSWKEIKASGIPIPCTPYGIMHMLERENIDIEGKNAVVLGRSSLVGKPISLLLLSRNATVTMAHSRTKDIEKTCQNADILIAAIGIPEFVKDSMVKPGAVVVDVGISRTEAGLKGDVDFMKIKDKASWITPVPGGVGRMTVAMLLLNTVKSAEKLVNK